MNIVIFLLFGFGLLLLLMPKEKEAKVKSEEKKQKKSLKWKVNELLGKNKKNFFQNFYEELNMVLTLMGRQSKFNTFKNLSIICALVGALICIAIGNYLLIPVFSLGFFLMPLWYFKLSYNKYKKLLDREIEVSLISITTSYLRNYNLKQSVTENLEYFNSPVKEIFQEFISETEYSSNIYLALVKLKEKLFNPIAKSWVDQMIACQNDKTLAPILLITLDKFRSLRNLQAELELELYKPIKEYTMMVILTLSIVPILFVTSKEWFNVLWNQVIGHILMVITFIVILLGYNKAIKISKPIEWEE